jgi:hypothetical protein
MRPAALLALLLAVSAPAAPAATFAGFELGAFEHEISVDGSGTNLVAEDDDDYVGLKAGQLAASWRGYATLHVPDTDTDDSVWWLSASYDHLFLAGRPLQPFIGGHVGYYRFDADGSDLRISAITVGPELGVLLRFEPFVAEFGYRFGFGLANSDNRSGVDYQVDEAQALYLGINLAF